MRLTIAKAAVMMSSIGFHGGSFARKQADVTCQGLNGGTPHKNLAEFICHYEYFYNFVFGEHSGKSICLNYSTTKPMLYH